MLPLCDDPLFHSSVIPYTQGCSRHVEGLSLREETERDREMSSLGRRGEHDVSNRFQVQSRTAFGGRKGRASQKNPGIFLQIFAASHHLLVACIYVRSSEGENAECRMHVQHIHREIEQSENERLTASRNQGWTFIQLPALRKAIRGA